jgi:mRNA interferase MazF
VVVRRFDVHLVTLDPTVGSEMQKTRPCLVISPDEMNRNVRTAIVAPLTTRGRPYPSRIPVRFQGQRGLIALDQMRSVDRARLIRRLGKVSTQTEVAVLEALQDIFAR